MDHSRQFGSIIASLFVLGTVLTGISAPVASAAPARHQAMHHNTRAIHAGARVTGSDGVTVVYPERADLSQPVTTLAQEAPQGVSYVTTDDNGDPLYNATPPDEDGSDGSTGSDVAAANAGGFNLPVPVHASDTAHDRLLERKLVKHTVRRHTISINPGPANFNGIASGGTNPCGCAPPDTNMDVGLHYIVETTNLAFAVYSKTGATILPATPLNALWFGLGGACESRNDGDPIVLYDSSVDRWVISQFTAAAPFSECIAISQTSNPAGAYFRYQYVESNVDFGDYPHLGIWPSAGNNVYGMTVNVFANDTRYEGSQPYLFDRAKLLAGNPLAPMVQFPTVNGAACLADPTFAVCRNPMLPADADGGSGPQGAPANSPDIFMEYPDPGPPTFNSLYEYFAQFDAANPANSTFNLNAAIPVAPFNNSGTCMNVTRNCIPQPGSSASATGCSNFGTNNVCKLDPISDRLMHRLAFRNVGGTESLLANWTVNASSTSTDQAAPRWVEIHNPFGAPTVAQQGTQAPDTANNRWLGSIDQDRMGNDLLGYSVSGTTTFPSIRVAGRSPGDPANTLGSEINMFSGSFSQRGISRWGDYANMKVDPTDGCTFWYSQEYIQNTSSTDLGDWHTRIGSFRFANCDNSPASMSVTAGSPTSAGSVDQVTVTLHDAQGFDASTYTGTVQLSSSDGAIAGLPSNYTFTAADSGSHTFNVVFNSQGSQTVTAVDTSNPSLTDTANVSVTAPVDHFVVTAPASVGAGLPFTFSVAAVDASNATLTNYTGTVHFSSSDGGALLPADYTFTAADNGVHTFTNSGQFNTGSIKLLSLGSQSLTATDTGGIAHGSTNINVVFVNTYVNGATGSNSNDCLTNATSCQTIAGAIAKTSVGGTVFVNPGTYFENVVIDHNLTLTGINHFATQNVINGGGVNSTVVINNGVTATVAYLEITNGNGNARGGGAGVFNGSGSVTLNGDYITGNKATAASGLGGGVLNNLSAGGTVLIRNSTISNNTLTGATSFGGAVYAAGASVTILNSTLSGNKAGGDGAIRWRGCGGECTSDVNKMVNTTVTGNTVATSANGNVGGLDRSGANPSATMLGNDIVAKNTTFAGGVSDCGSVYTTLGNNVVGGACSGLTNGVSGDQVGTNATPIDPLVGALQDNGGPTPTESLGGSSPAIDHGSNALCADGSTIGNLDQRGFPRPFNGICDAGAVEVGAMGAPVITWSNPADITYPTALSGTQLDATADVPGVFAYSPPAGTVLNAGTNQVLSTLFTPSDTTDYSPVNAAVNINVLKGNQTITFGALADKTYEDPDFNVTATASSGLSVSFSAVGACTVTGNTVHLLSSGVCTITASQAGDANWNPATSVSQSFSIAVGPVSLTSTTALQLFAQGKVAAVSATLKDGSGNPISGRSILITVGPSAAAAGNSCTGLTNGSGVAACSFTLSASLVPQGNNGVTDSFAGDAYYHSAGNNQSALVYAFTSTGAFVVGDKTATGSVNWWGSQWANNNVLSGGSAPSSMKGFASNTPSLTCGSSYYTTTTGNSSIPPATVPGYMAVAVSSKVTQSGSTINGNIVHMVIVKTNPGYANDPSHPGTGTVVAQIC